METEKIIFLRGFLFKTFLVGILFAILLLIGTVAMRGVYMPVATRVFQIESNEVNELILASFLNLRVVLLFLLLAPAVALHWIIGRKK